MSQLKNQSFSDPEFQPNETSLGSVPDVNIDKWKRVSELTHGLKLFGQEVQPHQAISFKNEKMEGFQAVAACLAERPNRIRSMFGEQRHSKNGGYGLFLRQKGEIQEVAFDDYVPVNNEGHPLFSKPVHSSIWMTLLEKARAKAYGSYQKMS